MTDREVHRLFNALYERALHERRAKLHRSLEILASDLALRGLSSSGAAVQERVELMRGELKARGSLAWESIQEILSKAALDSESPLSGEVKDMLDTALDSQCAELSAQLSKQVQRTNMGQQVPELTGDVASIKRELNARIDLLLSGAGGNMNEPNADAIEKKLLEKYFLIRKRDWYWWVGGVSAFLVAYFALNYKTTLNVLSEDNTRKVRDAIVGMKAGAEAGLTAIAGKNAEADGLLKELKERATHVSEQPLKIVIPDEAARGKLLQAYSYWGDNGHAGPHPCEFVPVKREGFEFVFKSSTFQGGRDPRCQVPAGHCDSLHEHCEYTKVEAGCYINSDWLTWYRAYLKKYNLQKYEDPIRECEVLS